MRIAVKKELSNHNDYIKGIETTFLCLLLLVYTSTHCNSYVNAF